MAVRRGPTVAQADLKRYAFLQLVYDSLFYNLISQMGHKLIPESELEKNQLVMADGHACLGEMLLFLGESEEARKNLEIALRGYKDHSGPENILLDKANMLHFLGEAYRNRYSRFSHNTVISPQHLRCLISYCNVTPF